MLRLASHFLVALAILAGLINGQDGQEKLSEEEADKLIEDLATDNELDAQ